MRLKPRDNVVERVDLRRSPLSHVVRGEQHTTARCVGLEHLCALLGTKRDAVLAQKQHVWVAPKRTSVQMRTSACVGQRPLGAYAFTMEQTPLAMRPADARTAMT